MKKNLKNLILIILAVLAISAICYPQTKFWEPVSSNPLSNPNIPLEHRNAKGCAITNNGDIFVLTEEGVFLSADNGDTWVQKHVFPVPYMSAIAASGYGSIFVVYQNGLYMFRSTDNGESWKTIRPPYYMISGGMLFTESGEIYLGYEAFGDWTGIYYSKDNGDTWVRKPVPYIFADFAMGTDGTLYTSIENNRLLPLERGIYRSTDAGDNWFPLNTSIGRIKGIILIGDSTIIGVGEFNILVKSTDRGVTWSQIISDELSPGRSGGSAGALYNPITGHIFVFGYKGVARSTDQGETWDIVTSGLPAGNIMDWAINPTTGMLFVTLSNIKYDSMMVYRSTQNIDRVDIDMLDFRLIDFNPNQINFDPIYLGSETSTALYITNRGKIDIVLRDVDIDRNLYQSSQFRTDFNGPVVIKPNEDYGIIFTFSPKIEGTPTIFDSLSSYSSQVEIYTDVTFSTYSLYGMAINKSISVEEPAEIPTEYSLSQNYPNPFNPTTKIEYSLPVASKVRMSVYNSLGQEVAILIDEHQGMGKHIIDFNAMNLPSGIYFYKLQTDKFNAVRKMMLVK